MKISNVSALSSWLNKITRAVTCAILVLLAFNYGLCLTVPAELSAVQWLGDERTDGPITLKEYSLFAIPSLSFSDFGETAAVKIVFDRSEGIADSVWIGNYFIGTFAENSDGSLDSVIIGFPSDSLYTQDNLIIKVKAGSNGTELDDVWILAITLIGLENSYAAVQWLGDNGEIMEMEYSVFAIPSLSLNAPGDSAIVKIVFDDAGGVGDSLWVGNTFMGTFAEDSMGELDSAFFSFPLDYASADSNLAITVKSGNNGGGLDDFWIISSDLTLEYYAYVPGDANMANGEWPPRVNGADVTYLVAFFRGLHTNPGCYLNGVFAAADINASCTIIGADVTRFVTYFRGVGIIEFCPEVPPAWLTPGDCPPEAPEGWPGCEPFVGSADRTRDIDVEK